MTTTALVPVFTGDNGTTLCNARNLHSVLESGQDFSDWIKNRIEKYGFIEGEDFSINFGKTSRRGGRPTTDYHLTLDMAKELAMVENNERGRQVRRYFIAIEKEARSNVRSGASAPKALRAAELDKDTQQRINRYAWLLAQTTFERFRKELTFDIEHQLHLGAVEEWKPKEYREDLLEMLAANAMVCHTFGDSIHRNARKLAEMAGVDYAAISARYIDEESH